MTQQVQGDLVIEDRGAVLVARVDGGPHSLFGVQIATRIDALVDRAAPPDVLEGQVARSALRAGEDRRVVPASAAGAALDRQPGVVGGLPVAGRPPVGLRDGPPRARAGDRHR